MDEQDKSYSKAEMAGMVQASLAICATCSHERGAHEGDKACLAQWDTGNGVDKVHHVCQCSEYWPIREQREDDLPVRGFSISIGGGAELELNRRVTTELWESLKAEREVTLHLRAKVVGKGFKADKSYGLVESRKLEVVQLLLAGEVDPETGELL